MAALVLPAQPTAAQPPAPGGAVAALLAPVRWGMTAAEVQRALVQKARQSHGSPSSAADAVAERLAQSYVALDGSATPWDMSFLREELTPGPGNALLVNRDALSQTVYLFRAGKLHRLYTLFEPLAFPEGNFNAFVSALSRRFGPGTAQSGALPPGTSNERRWVEWHDRTTRVRAIDETNRHGFYCLLIEPLVSVSAGVRPPRR